ncbi:MAG: class I SAM-dependent methyltransferase [Acidimicrobiia bacterium]|nr:class I SAM-dependent methyltransferase [Acidimicrobiia bacterium]
MEQHKGHGTESLRERLLEGNRLPDWLIRWGIRRTIAGRLREERSPTAEAAEARIRTFVEARSQGPLAVATSAANAQHYEVPTVFFQRVLGAHLKYSSGYWDPGVTALDEAERRMLALTAERAGLVDGQRILELGCGWGSLSLWMARHYPASEVVVVSNSRTQKQLIDGIALREGLTNLTVITADMNTFEAPGTFDRVVSVEMFEHMRNWRELFARIARWLRPDGLLFFHIFTHRQYAYAYDVRDRSDWMAAHFFTGGIMPSDDFPIRFQADLVVDEHWRESGTHYQKTAEAWLVNMDRHRDALWPLFEQTYGASEATRWWVRWRVFFMACAELWGWRGGDEWLVTHYRMRPRPLGR